MTEQRVALEEVPDHPAWVLEGAMSALSEECYCAGWMQGTEVALWRIGTGTGTADWGMCADEIRGRCEALVKTAEAIGWWVGYDRKRGPVAILVDEWKRQMEADQ